MENFYTFVGLLFVFEVDFAYVEVSVSKNTQQNYLIMKNQSFEALFEIFILNIFLRVSFKSHFIQTLLHILPSIYKASILLHFLSPHKAVTTYKQHEMQLIIFHIFSRSFDFLRIENKLLKFCCEFFHARGLKCDLLWTFCTQSCRYFVIFKIKMFNFYVKIFSNSLPR